MEPTDVEATLDRLQQESEERRAELRSIAAQLSEVQSRRTVLVTMVRDVRTNADVGDIVTRVARKIARAPRAALRRLQQT